MSEIEIEVGKGRIIMTTEKRLKISDKEWTFKSNQHWYNTDPKYLSQVFNSSMMVERLLSDKDIYEFGGDSLIQCPHCAASITILANWKESTLQILGEPCKYPKGVYPIIIELNVTSGKIVFANDLREWFPVIGSKDINLDHNIKIMTEEYTKVGMVHPFVGNSYPSIYQVDDQHLSISIEPFDEDDSVSAKDLEKITPPGKLLGNISTDLWWYSAVDYKDFENRFLIHGSTTEFENFLEKECNIAEVKPGVYQFEHRLVKYEDDLSETEPTHYTTIKWIRGPEIDDKHHYYTSQNFTAGQILLDSMLNFPSLYIYNRLYRADHKAKKLIEQNFEKLSRQEKIKYILSMPDAQLKLACQRAADHIFCVNGNGVDWHPNGWGSDSLPSKDLPDMQIPLFDGFYRWYDIQPTFSAVCCAAGMFAEELPDFYKKEEHYLNHSFRALAFIILHSVVKYGVDTSPSFAKDEAARAKQSRVNAKQALLNLAKKYPADLLYCCKTLFDDKAFLDSISL